MIFTFPLPPIGAAGARCQDRRRIRPPRPRVVMSDDSLLRALCRRMCVGRSLVHARYTLMSRLLQCWPAAAAPAPVSLPFPVPNAGEQISGTLTLVCHFSTEVLRWVRMEEEARRPQRRRQQQQQQPGKSPGQGLVGMRQRELLRGAKPVLLQACSMRAIFPMMDAVTDTASEVSCSRCCAPLRASPLKSG